MFVIPVIQNPDDELSSLNADVDFAPNEWAHRVMGPAHPLGFDKKGVDEP